MTKPNLQELARVGAQARLAAIQEERSALLAMFPELKEGRASNAATATPSAPAPRIRKRPPMSAAQKKAVGERMKAYWARRRAEQPEGGDSAQAAVTRSNGSSRKSGRKPTRKQGRKK